MRALAAVSCMFLAAPPQVADFRNIDERAGLTHSFPNGGATAKQFIIETTGSGVALIDYDNDGFLDIFIVSGKGGSNRLYHNDGHSHFTDVTAETGLLSDGWGQGVCARDYDNNGDIDLFVTYWGQNRLYRNIGGKRFEDVTAAAHLTQDRIRYNTGRAFIDYTNHARLHPSPPNYPNF